MFPIFMWIKEYNGLKDFKINLDSNYGVRFETNVNEIKGEEELKILNLKIEKLESRTPDGFYGDNIDSINLILGKNGTGKSSILDVLSIINIHEKEIEHMIIYKTKEEDKYVLEGYYSREENYFSFLRNKPEGQIIYEDSFLIDSNNNFLGSSNKSLKNKVILSESMIVKFKTNEKSILGKSWFESDHRKDIIVSKYRINSKEYSYLYLYNYLHTLKNKNSENYRNVEIKLNIKDYFNASLSIDLKNMLENFDFKKEILVLYQLNTDSTDYKEEILKNYANGLFLYHFNEKTKDIKSKENFNSVNVKLKERYTKENIEESIAELLKDINSIMTPKKESPLETKNVIIDFLKIIDQLKLDNYKVSNDNFFEEEYQFEMKFNFSLLKENEKLKFFLKQYDKDLNGKIKSYTYGTLADIFEIKVKNLSDGEKSFLEFFVNIFKIIEFDTRKYITLMFDEVENFLHPEWARNLLNELITELKENYPNKVFKLIFVSHSPFLLSDVLSKNCIFLEKKENQTKIKEVEIKNFGANIHELLKSGMFMDSTFGEFSRNKIKKIVAKLQGSYNKLEESEVEEIKFVIDSIGEPLVANKLRKMLKKKTDNDDGNKMERWYKKKIEELELENKLQPVKI